MPLRVSCPGPVLRLVSSGGGGGPVLAPPCLALGCRLVAGPVHPGRFCTWGVCGGGEGGAVASPPGGAAGSGSLGGSRGSGGRGSLCLGLSLCLPRTGTNAGFFGVALSMEGVVPILLRFVSVRSCLDAVGEGRREAPLCTGWWLAGRPVGWPATSPQLAEVTVGTERAGDGSGAPGMWALRRSAPGAAVLQGERGGRGHPWPGGGVQA